MLWKGRNKSFLEEQRKQDFGGNEVNKTTSDILLSPWMRMMLDAYVSSSHIQLFAKHIRTFLQLDMIQTLCYDLA